MIFDILTLFPAMFASPLEESILGKARERGLVTVRVVNIRDFAEGRHLVTDDRPFGGGEGMVMKPEPIARALDAVRADGPPPRVVLLSPAGRLFTQAAARDLAAFPRVVLICGRYEGVDERVSRLLVDDELSIGDYVLTGGEFPAMVVVDAVSRLIPGVLGNAASPEAESFSEPLLEHPQYTRPQDFMGERVPEVLLSGDHEAVRRWRRGRALLRTKVRRPDLFSVHALTREDERLLFEAEREAQHGEAP